MNMPVAQFLALDSGGACIYILTYFSAGFIFSDFLGGMMRGYSVFGSAAGWVIAALFAVWLGNRFRLWWKARNENPVPMITPREAAARTNAAIFDVRSHGYYEQGTFRIQGSARLEPNALGDYIETLPRDREIVLYCTCIREATAVRVARVLAERGIPSVVIEGGLSAWKKALLPLEPVPADEVVPLPKFS
jgi:rhodanese-related sulfurtransferase